MSPEAMIAAAPQFILTNNEGMDDSGGAPIALSSPGAQLTPAGKSGQIFSIPGKYLQGFGLLTPEAMRFLAVRLHPELSRDPGNE
jgi:iron complex transport system substrate-binding protein